MNSKKIRVAWLAPYPPGLLQPELRLARRSKAHPASWVVNLANAFAEREDLDLHVITASAGILENQTVIKGGITFHVIRHTFPFTIRGFPAYMRFAMLTCVDRQGKFFSSCNLMSSTFTGPNTATAWGLWRPTHQQLFPSKAL